MSYSVTNHLSSYHAGRIRSELANALPRYIEYAENHPERYANGILFLLGEPTDRVGMLGYSEEMRITPKALEDGKQHLFREAGHCHEHVYLAAHMERDAFISIKSNPEATEALLQRVCTSVHKANLAVLDRVKTKAKHQAAAKAKRDAKRQKIAALTAQ